MTNIGGYGRYKDDPEYIGCPRAKSDMTPCIARDGSPALADDLRCVGCDMDPMLLLVELRNKVTGPGVSPAVVPRDAADQLTALVRKATA